MTSPRVRRRLPCVLTPAGVAASAAGGGGGVRLPGRRRAAVRLLPRIPATIFTRRRREAFTVSSVPHLAAAAVPSAGNAPMRIVLLRPDLGARVLR